MSTCNLYNPLCFSILADNQAFSLDLFTNYSSNHFHTSEPNESIRESLLDQYLQDDLQLL